MNAKEVLTHAADMAAGQGPGTRAPVHPNDRVNRSPSSNGRLPTVMQMGAVDEARGSRPRPRSGRAFGGIPCSGGSIRTRERWCPCRRESRPRCGSRVPEEFRRGRSFAGGSGSLLEGTVGKEGRTAVVK
ncbi:hypothetical protein [Cereibacter sphaeroides]|uniref:hypothetical protein n=1 Tax=Cereibacter sphaeroides TaxID=1063 RepID=UPI001E551E36|nr:hypothetical protein [Cereibacter sphaeroides]